MAQRRASTTRAIGETLVRVVPLMLTALSAIGTAAMLWVGGGILLHGLEELHIGGPIPHWVHEVSVAAGEATGALGGIVAWLVVAFAGAVVGIVIGGIIAAIVRRFTKRPEELIVD
jgi:predicted DNA repair protein MutK